MKSIIVCISAICLFGRALSGFGEEASSVAPPAPSEGPRVRTVELTPEVSKAINRGLAYLAKRQGADGRWGWGAVTANTSLGIMAFMLQGHVPKRGQYGDNLDKAITYLINQGENDAHGYLLALSAGHAGMYEHGLGILALSEAWGQSKNPKIRDVLRRAVDITLRCQNAEGGWRYAPEPNDADISMTVMQIVALNSAKEAGISVPDATLKKAVRYVLKCQEEADGSFRYQPGGGGPGMPFARTAAGVMSLIMGGERNSKAVRRGIEYLKQYPDSKFNPKSGQFHFLYGHYYAIQCMYQSGDADFQAWYPKISAALLAAQNKEGGWDSEQGDVYGTAVSILILGVPYRFLPIYQR